MQSVEHYTEQVRTLTQQCIETFDRFMDESYDRVNGAIDSIYNQICLKPVPEQKKDQRISTELVKLPDAPQLKIDLIIDITPDEIKSFRQKRSFQLIFLQTCVIIEEEQEVFERQEDLLQILANANYIIIDDDDSSSIYKKLLDILKKDEIKDWVAYLQSFKYQDQKEKEQIKRIINILKNLKDHEFNLKDYSSEAFEEIKKDLIKKLQDDKSIMDLLKFLVQFTSIDDQFIQCGSNSLHILVIMKVDVRNQSFENIRIKNTSLIGGNFVRCNLNGSELWILEESILMELKCSIWNCLVFCFSPDGNTLASGSDDKSIRLWDVKTAQEIKSSDKNYKDIFAQFKIPLQNSQLLPNVETILRICLNPFLEAQGTLGDFIKQKGIELKPLFKFKGSCFFEGLKQK
ncbi:unnamed protein product [Paramecium primaurelia]|uniref:Uncharacterized protein n=1 Tax=Paramecium primaurelia TaxID=5886 RepID=A0A8S1N1X0_PARPR|nr:unnamed protein product [Paramecium primaurelia]